MTQIEATQANTVASHAALEAKRPFSFRSGPKFNNITISFVHQGMMVVFPSSERGDFYDWTYDMAIGKPSWQWVEA